MTKKQAYKIIENKYGHFDDRSYIGPLCTNAPKELRRDWCEYWNRIIEDRLTTISQRFTLTDKDWGTLSGLTRLILLHDFIEDTY